MRSDANMVFIMELHHADDGTWPSFMSGVLGLHLYVWWGGSVFVDPETMPWLVASGHRSAIEEQMSHHTSG